MVLVLTVQRNAWERRNKVVHVHYKCACRSVLPTVEYVCFSAVQ